MLSGQSKVDQSALDRAKALQAVRGQRPSGIADQMIASSQRFRDVASTKGLAAAMRDQVHNEMAASIAGNFDFTGGIGGMAGMAGMLLDARQLAKPRGKIDAAYPPWGSTDIAPGMATRDVALLKNPSPGEIERLKNRHETLRWVHSKDGTGFYIWPAEDALHPEVAADVYATPRVQDPKTGVWTNTYNQGIVVGNKR